MPPAGPPPLTPKQQQILAWLRDEPEHTLTLVKLAENASSKVDTMRRMCERLTDRKLIKPVKGADERSYVLTTAGARAIGDREPAPLPPTANRGYQVLEQRSLLGALRYLLDDIDFVELMTYVREHVDSGLEEVLGAEVVFVPVAEVEARNTTHAYRITMRDHRARLSAGEPMLSAVSQRHWQPVPVSPIHREPIIAIG